MRNSVEAYLDNFGLVNVYIDQKFFCGKSERFYMKNDKNRFVECIVRATEIQNDCTKYELVIPGDYEFGEKYYITESHGFTCEVQVRGVVQTPHFNELFPCNCDDLGVTYTKEKSTFKLFAPTATSVLLEIIKDDSKVIRDMKRHKSGVYVVEVDFDINLCKYCYHVEANGEIHKALDPYAISGSANGEYSGFVDINTYEKLYQSNLGLFDNNVDAIIYELSIRDFTHSDNTNTKTHSLFNSLTEDNTTFDGMPTGLNYLKSLGITHVQMMPVTDFFTVDEMFPNVIYNWGYDPCQYGVTEGSYCSDPNDVAKRVFELKRLVEVLHHNNMRVNLDVVFNHHYDVRLSNLEAIMPYYCFRVNSSGFLSNGSFCGNDIESRQPMVRKYIVDMCTHLIKTYDIDGLRFDLMGILDIETMRQVYKACTAIKPNFMIYGEGWDMPTSLAQDEKTIQVNSAMVPHIGFFNDVFRDVVKGKTSHEDAYVSGYATGDIGLSNAFLNCLLGHCGKDYRIYQNPGQTINYVECHDNQTAWDKMKDCCKGEGNQTRIERQKLMLAIIMVAQGVPFIHSGQEFCRTKAMMHNTYNTRDSINEINWKRLIDYKEVYYYFQKLVQLRKQYSSFRLRDNDEIDQIKFEIKNKLVYYYIDDLCVVFNATLDDISMEMQDYKCIFDEYGFVKNIEKNNIRNLSMQVFQKGD